MKEIELTNSKYIKNDGSPCSTIVKKRLILYQKLNMRKLQQN